MPRTADRAGSSNPFDVNAALKALGKLFTRFTYRFGNLGSRLRPTMPVRDGFGLASRRAAVYQGNGATMFRLSPAIPPSNGGWSNSSERNAPQTGAVLGCG